MRKSERNVLLAAALAAGFAASATVAAADCSRVGGNFVADGGKSRLQLDGAGNGHMWQETYGGSQVYTFDVDFTYSGTRDAMRFDYGPAIYKDASGREIQRQNIPGGDAQCAYDGRTVTINGKPFAQQ